MDLSQSAWKNNERPIPEEMMSRQPGTWDWSSGREQKLSITSDTEVMQDP